MFLKLGEAIYLTPENHRIEEPNAIFSMLDPQKLDEFRKFATQLKKVAPKAEDFLYFSCIMMSAAEASAINDDGAPKTTVKGEPVKVGWNTNNETWRWITNDPSIKPYKNQNGDIFPEAELIKAHKKWIGKPLCIDHKSSSVDHVRGFIVDTHYDPKLKRVIALCALDKFNYPDLARKVQTGYQTAVSMGTGVGKAICFDCGNVARTEAEFCNHMKTKSCYGEINVDLNPIELSIVVNGADPKAHIKHVIAAANTLNAYVEAKENQMNKLSKQELSSALQDFKSDIDSAFKKLEEISQSASVEETSTNDAAYNQSSGTLTMPESEFPGTDQALAPPTQRFLGAETNNDLKQELMQVMASIEKQLLRMQYNMEKLGNLNPTKEDTMSGSRNGTSAPNKVETKDTMQKQSYFQGGGGLNEPTPHERRYDVDPLNEHLRDQEDKQMVGKKPFPGVGDVEGLYPTSHHEGKSDLDLKKMLARAEADERAMRRNAVLQKVKDALETTKKESYWQGGGGLNEPTPGKRRYEVDPLNEHNREEEDKQMVGQKPFPDVGDVEGLHPSPASADVKDELQRKKLLQRASLKAKFVKDAANPGRSTWHVFMGEKDNAEQDQLLMTASVAEIAGGKADALYNVIASETYGKDLLAKVKAFGAEKAANLIKTAQAAPPPPASTPVTVPPMGGEMSSAPAGDSMPDADKKDGNLQQKAMEACEKAQNSMSDCHEVLKELFGEQAEMGDLGELGAPADAGSAPMADDAADGRVSTAALQSMRKELNGALIVAFKECAAELKSHVDELKTITAMFEKNVIKEGAEDVATNLVEDAINDTNLTLAKTFTVMDAFIKYANGTEAMIKRAQEEAEMLHASDGDNMDMSLMAMIGDTGKEIAEIEAGLAAEDGTTATASAEDMVDALLADDIADANDADEAEVDEADADDNDATAIEESSVSHADDNAGKDAEMESSVSCASDQNSADAVKVTTPDMKTVVVPAGSQVANATLETKAAREALRTKLAADIKWNPMFYDFHPKGGAQPGPLDVKPQDKLEVVENLVERHERMLEVANMPPKVRKEAEVIQQLVSEGKLDPSQMDELVANGVDPAAVKYWKEFYGQAGSEGKEFASELVKEHAKAQLEEENTKYRVKLARAYELTYDEVNRGLVANTHEAIAAEVDSLMKCDDQSFDSLKRMVARHAPVMQKSAGRLPQVGLVEQTDVANGQDNDLVSQLTAAFSTSNKRMF
jgi:hypothetical protein